jgi:hypothetical protein
VEGSGCGLIYGTILAFEWKDWEKPQKNLCQDSQAAGRDVNQKSSWHAAEVLLAQLRWSAAVSVVYLLLGSLINFEVQKMHTFFAKLVYWSQEASTLIVTGNYWWVVFLSQTDWLTNSMHYSCLWNSNSPRDQILYLRRNFQILSSRFH